VDVLVLHPGAMGDVILSLPALASLRARFPAARITLAANTDFAGTVACGIADRMISLSHVPLHRLYAAEPISPEDLLFWRQYDRILSWTGSNVAHFARRASECHPCFLVASWKPVPHEKRHVARIFVDSLQPWACVPPSRVRPEIIVPEAVRRESLRWLEKQGWCRKRPLIAMHPGAGNTAKRWPEVRFLELARKLADANDVLIIEGPAELGVGRDLAAALSSRVILASELPLPLLAGALRECLAFIGNDSGISHLACALSVPGFILFGPTKPEHWAPLGAQVEIIRDSGTCQACRTDSDSGHVCMSNIEVETVWRKLCRIPRFRKEV
jgi:heptosyltransferase-3